MVIGGKKGTYADVLIRQQHSFYWLVFAFYSYCSFDQIVLHQYLNIPILVLMLIGLIFILLLRKVRKDIRIEFPYTENKLSKWIIHIITFVITLAIMIPYCMVNLVFYRIFHTNDWFYTTMLITAVSLCMHNIILFVVRLFKVFFEPPITSPTATT